MMDRIKQELEDWVMFADSFDDPDDKNQVMIRNAVLRQSINKNLKDCTMQEIVESKYQNLQRVIDKHPELIETIKQKIA